MLDADQFAALLPSRPILSSRDSHWRGVVVERYRHPPSTIDVPGLQNHLLVVHLRGPLAVEERRERGHWERRWTDREHVSLTPSELPVARRFVGRPDVLLIQLEPHLLERVIEEALDRDSRSIELVPRFAVRDPALDHFGERLMDEARLGDVLGHELMIDLLTRAVAVQLLRRHSDRNTDAISQPMTIIPARLRRAIEFMREHRARRLRLDDLAAVSGLSASRFGRAFRETTGVSPYQYLVDLRIEKARDLLEHTTLPMIDVALQCGFEQPSHFTNTFRSRVGVSPRAWRAERRG